LGPTPAKMGSRQGATPTTDFRPDAQPCLRSNSFMNSMSACTPASGMAL